MSWDAISYPAEKLDLYSQCLRKVAFPTFDSARLGCHAIVRKEAARGNLQPFTVYICPHCFSYHIGKVPVADVNTPVEVTSGSVAL